MLTSDRREFLKKSMVVAPAAEGVLFARSAGAETQADTQRGLGCKLLRAMVGATGLEPVTSCV